MTTKELIDSLRACGLHGNCGAGCAMQHSTQADCLKIVCVEAAARLEALEAELKDEMYRHDRRVDFGLAVERELKQTKAERDAAIADIKVAWLCATCKKHEMGREWMYCRFRKFMEQPNGALTCDNFEWRGVVKE